MQPKTAGTWNDDPAHFRPPTRRSFLYVGLVGGLGLTLDEFFRLQARADTKANGAKEPPAKSLIHIFLPGGMAHQDSFDPKPYAPIEYRGELGTIPTKLDGVFFNEYLKQTAQVADKITICRSMTHGEAAHERGTHNMFTGYRPSPALVFPSMGSVVSHEFGPRNNLPPYVCIPSQPTTYAGTGYLSSAYAPFSLGSDPADWRLLRAGSQPAGRRRRQAVHHAPDHARRRQRALRYPRKGRRHRGDGHVLPAGLQPDQLAEGAARHSTSTQSRPLFATNMAATPRDSACYWRGGWWRPASALCR